MHSAHPPERLEVELRSLLGPSLSQRGYRVVGHGVSGITWRRDMSGKLITGLVALGLFALGGLSSGDAGATVLGLASAVVGVALFYFRRPATITVTLSRLGNGTETVVSGGPDAAKAEEIVRAVAASETSMPRRSDPSGPLWSQSRP